LRENIEKIYYSIEKNYLVDCFKIMRNHFSKKLTESILIEGSEIKKDGLFLKKTELENPKQLILKILSSMHYKFFSQTSNLFQTFNEIMVNKGYQVSY
jgi:hypothetical protein